KNAPAEPPQAAEEPPAPIDLTLLDDIDVAGTVKLGGLNLRGLEARNVNMSVTAREGKLSIGGISANLYEGSLTGALTADAQNQFTGELGLKEVSMGPLLQALTGSDRGSGVGSLALDLTTQGATVPALKSGLAGTARLQARDGAIRGIDLNQTLAQVGGVLTTVLDGEGPDL